MDTSKPMSQELAEVTAEIGGVNVLAFIIVVTQAQWGEYLSEPANIVSLVVALGALGFSFIRGLHYYYKVSDRNEERRNRRKASKP